MNKIIPDEVIFTEEERRTLIGIIEGAQKRQKLKERESEFQTFYKHIVQHMSSELVVVSDLNTFKRILRSHYFALKK